MITRNRTWIFLLLLSIGVSCRQSTSTPEAESITTPTGLTYKILKSGTGTPAKAGDEVLIFETTTYRDGTVLYSNENTDTPVQVLIGGNQATEGVDEGLRGMQPGEIRELIAPPYLVKRTSYPPNVHPDSTLVIKIILHKIL